jgi:hypothetical protein
LRYYIKRLGRQELGSPKADGSVSRGRYFYISQNSEDYFPPLSATELNDTIIIPIISPASKEKVYCSYVYHNSKFHPGKFTGEPRNEKRVYMNTSIDPDRSYFTPGDIVVFNKIDSDELVSEYELFLFRVADKHYTQLNDIIEKFSIGGGHALYEGVLEFIIPTAQDIPIYSVIPEEVKNVVSNKQLEVKESKEYIDEEAITKGANLFSSVSFRDFILHGYNYKCAVTNSSIYYNTLNNLEAAHIMPKSQNGPFLPCNGIAMSRDIHWAFDKGMFSIDDDFKIFVHEDVIATPLAAYSNQKINLPAEDYFKPEVKYLKYHRDRIFGLFKYSGSL